MIEMIRNLLTTNQAENNNRISDINLAAAALLIEVMVIDQHPDPEEERKIKLMLSQRLGLEESDVASLFDAAHREVSNATSLFQFTRQVNDEFNREQKFDLVVELWQVAYADGLLDKHEEHLIRRISDLIHLPHSEFIRAKNTARN